MASASHRAEELAKEFPISGVVVSPILLPLAGFTIGALGGFFGVGGGFLAGPLMIWIGVPINFVVGTDLAPT